MTISFRSFLFASLAALGSCAPSEVETRPAAAPPMVAERVVCGSATVVKLSNGLTVIVRATRDAPVVCVRAYVRAGSLYEGRWLGCGISHLTEHLLAKGASHDMGPGAAAQARQTSGRVAQIGGQSNAYTSLDHTCYYISAASDKAMDCIDLVAGWMARPEITVEDFRREHGVVQRELEMRADEPDRQMWRAHSANFFARHPAGVPVIGYAGPLAEVTYADVVAYHRLMYTPQNMILAVVGDIDVDAVLRRVRRAFAGFSRGRAQKLMLPAVPKIAGTRRVVRTHKALREVMQRMSFRTVPLVHDDLYALDVLSYVLTQGRSSRLERTIKRKLALVTSISSSSWTPPWGAGMFTISFRSLPDKADAAEKAIIEELKSVVAEGVGPNELARAKRQKVADFVYSQQTVESVAATLATDLLSTGDVEFSKNYTDRIQSVTAEDLRRVARKYFDFDAIAITRLEPEGEVPPPPKAAKEPPGRQAAATRMFKLPNGLRVVLHPTDAVGLVAMALVNRGGVLLEDEKTNGLGAMMAALSVKGAGDRSAEQIAEFFDRAGGSIAGNCGNNTFYWRASVLDDSFEEAMEILADIIQRPTFSAKELDILRPVLQMRIKQQDENWRGRLGKYFRRKFFTGSPYRLLPIGSSDVLAAATPKLISAWHDKYVRAGASVLAVYGNFDASAARRHIARLFAQMPEGDVKLPSPGPRKLDERLERHVLRTNNRLAAIMVAAPGMKITNLTDRLPIAVLDTIISGWRLPAGWLHTELRGKQLVYVVHAYNWCGLAPGAFQVYAACQPDKARQVVDIIRKDLDRAASYMPTQEEVDLAVNSILTAELLDNQTMDSQAMSAALDELYGFGYDFRKRLQEHYRKVSPADVLRVARKYLGRGYVVTVTTPAPATMETEDAKRQ